MSGLENRVRDLRFQLFAEDDGADPNIVIIAVDEESLNFYRGDLGTWPWPREVFGALVDFLDSGGADTIVFDMMFAEPDVSNPASDSLFSSSVERSGRIITSRLFAITSNRDRRRLRVESKGTPLKGKISHYIKKRQRY